MQGKTIRVALFIGVFLSVLLAVAMAAQDKYAESPEWALVLRVQRI